MAHTQYGDEMCMCVSVGGPMLITGICPMEFI